MTEHSPPTDPTTVPVTARPGADDSPAERSDLRGALEAATDDGRCPQCGDTAAPAGDGTCPACGARRPAARDHVEVRVTGAAGLTDRGRRRRRNEDALAVARTPTAAGDLLVGVVCDGVASARRGDEASLDAVEAAVEGALESAASGSADLETVAATAAACAARAAADLGRTGEPGPAHDPPACTYVGAVTLDGTAVVSWVGDSRVYWLDHEGSSQLLTTDDSWAEEIAAAGLMSRERAHADRRAHVLTRWLGADGPSEPARARRIRPSAPGVLMLCSDGVWNHLPDAAVLTTLVQGEDLLADARAVVGAALDDGGHDNATVVLLPVTPTGHAPGERAGEAHTGPVPAPREAGEPAGSEP